MSVALSSYLRSLAAGLALGLIGSVSSALAADHEAKLTLQNHRFSPEELVVPAGKKVKLVVENKDATAEEFESHDLNREKVVAGNASIVLYIGPLSPGRYSYYGEYNEKTARGVIVAQ